MSGTKINTHGCVKLYPTYQIKKTNKSADCCIKSSDIK